MDESSSGKTNSYSDLEQYSKRRAQAHSVMEFHVLGLLALRSVDHGITLRISAKKDLGRQSINSWIAAVFVDADPVTNALDAVQWKAKS